MADYTQEIVKRWAESAADINGGGIISTHGAIPLQAHTVTSLQCSGDAAALITIESPPGTIIWRKRYLAGFVMSEIFPPGTIIGAQSAAISLKIDGSTENCEGNFQGFTVMARP